MSRYWSDRVHQLKPYVPGEQPKLPRLIKLNTNENPFGPSEAVRSSIAAVADEDLRLYPDPESTELRETIAGYHGIRADQVFVGNGSDEILAHIFQAFFAREQVLRFPDITYSFYPVYCGLYGIDYRTVPLDDDFAIDPEDYRDASGGVIFPNPNAPTGRALPLADVETIVAANPDSVVVVDEAYVDFGAESAIALVGRYPNLLVSQTLSKSRSLAGLRVGFAVGHEDLIEGLNRVKNSFNSYPVDRLANAGAMASFQDEAGFQRTRRAVIDERERLSAALRELGFEVLPSAANFVFTRHSQFAGKALADTLRDQGIIVRHFDKPRIGDFLRITVGRPDQTDALIRALAAAVS